MSHNWSRVVDAYNQCVSVRVSNQSIDDLLSAAQFSSTLCVTGDKKPLHEAPKDLMLKSGRTSFTSPAVDASTLARSTPEPYVPSIMFMSNRRSLDASAAMIEFFEKFTSVRRVTWNFM